MNRLQLIPAIDIRHGKCVRLFKGDFAQETSYSVDPVERADYYRQLGVSLLHIVDLDGAKEGSPKNHDLIRGMAAAGGMQIQLGGGIRDERSLEQALKVADRVVIGSLALSAPQEVSRWIEAYGSERFTLGFDIRFSEHEIPMVTTHGWTKDSGKSLSQAIESFLSAGLKHVLCTDVDRDGAMQGPNLSLYEYCAEHWPQIAFQASGGVRNVGDLDALDAIGIAAAISGKALLDGHFSEEEMQRFLLDA
jgi:phosphoribosylformimino-5-aminoimidazole carboxamide ribotide isomerase